MHGWARQATVARPLQLLIFASQQELSFRPEAMPPPCLLPAADEGCYGPLSCDNLRHAKVASRTRY